MGKETQTFKAWVVTQKSSGVRPEDIFFTYGEAMRYKCDCFEPEHEAKVVPAEVTIKLNPRF